MAYTNTREIKENLVSVILCFYNEEKYLAGAIESVLAQTYKNFELILVSDGSTDRSCEIADSYDDPRIKRVYLDQNGGLASARNAGYDVAEGEYIAHFDGDDLLLPRKLEIQVNYMKEHPKTMVVSGGYYPMDMYGNVSSKPVLPAYYDDLDIRAAQMFIPVIANAGASLFRTSLVFEHGVRNNPEMKWCEDFHFWHQCFPYGKVENMPEVLFCYRIGYGSQTDRMVNEHKEKYLDLLFRILRYAWDKRGYDLKDEELWFILTHLHIKEEMIGPRERVFSQKLYQKIAEQTKALNLPEGDRILFFYKMREHEDLFFKRILQKTKHKLRTGRKKLFNVSDKKKGLFCP